ncbi:fumarylacetoacetate hydrolase family protein [Ideonella sp. B7]|uniref:2-keto-4-pentenoate hydratase n=1 Tax=Ideonella benzenivorans TaxID=2831643 RepID=UPI001CECEFB8|nr:fumarylacetoacetate hydrolase family protein [Ideonella benzenivorans]MCA6215986.1 fumarylacetoacetate hydrolase family protein [Ideonella benzenivorans]
MQAEHQAAQAILRARAARRPIPRISETHGIAGLDQAYAVAEINTKVRLAEPGRRVVGLKVGLTSPAVQQQLGVDQPDFGVLFDDMEYLDGDAIPMSRLIQPKVEAEVAFVVGRDLGGSHPPTWGEFLNALACALPALEIVDSVMQDWRLTLVDTVSDNASSGLYVLGLQPVTLGVLDLGRMGMQMSVNGTVRSEGTGAACLGHPLRAAHWLACTMAARGQPLRAGQVILSGALGPMVPLAAGDEVTATLGALGRVGCRMTA